MKSFKKKAQDYGIVEKLNKYIDMSIWNRVDYREPKKLLELLRDTGIIAFVVGTGTLCVTQCVSKIVSFIV